MQQIPGKSNRLFKKISKVLAPPPKLTVSQWADRYRKLSRESSSEAGQWKTARAPYQRDIMDSVHDPTVHETVVMSSAQVGKTEILNNIIGYFIDYDPAPMLIVQPTIEMGEAYSKDRIAPMIRDCASLCHKVADVKSKSSGNTILHKQFPGGHLTIVGANAPAGLAMRPIRILLFDEVDRYPASAGTEGDPIKLATKRTNNFWNRKIVKMSTPTIDGVSRIEMDYLLSSQGKWCVPCPSCGTYQPFSFHRIHFDTVCMECEQCHALHSQYEWKAHNQKFGQWIHEFPNHSVRGFHLNACASPWVKWEEIIEDFKQSKDRPELLKTFINTVLGETWAEKGEDIELEHLNTHVSRYDCEIPDKVLLLTAGVDVQDDRLEVEIVGWAEGQESWGIEYAILLGSPHQSYVWKSLDALLFRTFFYADGRKINILCTCVDSGYATDEVYAYCAQREHLRIFAVKGKGGFAIPMTDRPNRNNRYKTPLFTLGVDTLKDLFYARLRTQREGEGYCHFPLEESKGYSEVILKGFISEQKFKETDKQGGYKYVWKKKGGIRNEPLDCRNYATAALQLLEPIDFVQLRKRSQQDNPFTTKPTKPASGRRVISKGITL